MTTAIPDILAPMTTDTQGEAVVQAVKVLREPGFVFERVPNTVRQSYADLIESLSRQLAEAQEARDLNAAALECYSAEQARLRKELAEALAVLNTLRPNGTALQWGLRND